MSIAAIDVLIEENLVEASLELGEYFIKQLQKIESPVIKEIRGRGLFIGMELNEAARPYCEEVKRRRTAVQRNTPYSDPLCTTANYYEERIRLGC